MPEARKRLGMGWLPDYPDWRDYTAGHEKVRGLFEKAGITIGRPPKLPADIDLRPWCPAVEDQGELGSCTAQAGAGLVEYFERRAFGRHIEGSRRFLYKVTRNLLHQSGDTGAFLRTTMAALVLFGLPPEEYWPYAVSEFDVEPPAFCYAFAQNYQSIQYVRLDPPGTGREALLTQIKTGLAAGLPAMFGFTVYDSISVASENGRIPFPAKGEKMVGGHAVLAVGFDDKLTVKGPAPDGTATQGAILIRNSWGGKWGEKGYGWLPYEYVLRGLAVDWWSLLKAEWIDTGEFKL